MMRRTVRCCFFPSTDLSQFPLFFPRTQHHVSSPFLSSLGAQVAQFRAGLLDVQLSARESFAWRAGAVNPSVKGARYTPAPDPSVFHPASLTLIATHALTAVAATVTLSGDVRLVETQMKFHAPPPALHNTLFCRAVVLRKGGKLILTECAVYHVIDPPTRDGPIDGTLLMTATATLQVTDTPSPPSRSSAQTRHPPTRHATPSPSSFSSSATAPRGSVTTTPSAFGEGIPSAAHDVEVSGGSEGEHEVEDGGEGGGGGVDGRGTEEEGVGSTGRQLQGSGRKLKVKRAVKGRKVKAVRVKGVPKATMSKVSAGTSTSRGGAPDQPLVKSHALYETADAEWTDAARRLVLGDSPKPSRPQ